MKILRSTVVLAAALAAAGCISTSDFEAAQRQISELQEELANIKRTASSKDEVQNVNVRIAEQTETLLRSNATLVTKVNEIEERIQRTQGSVEQATHRLDQFAQQVSKTQRDLDDLHARIAAAQAPEAGSNGGEASGQLTVPAQTIPSSPSMDPMQTYQAAYRDYQRGNYDLAIEGFGDFLASSANSDLADNASYWIGEALFSQKKYREAIGQFDAVVNKYPKSDKVPGALLKKGYAYINVGERAQGVVQLQYVLHEHPKSQEASLARQKLKQLGIETK
ncbi:MAG: tol-pal system protein YbgF [Acidobacteriota bacterium]|nr:tol-pal system protein YbgF [Acidobacteriota bacterium]